MVSFNLKEAFRYQNFLERMFTTATYSLESRENCLKVTEHHYKSKANPEASDVVKEVEEERFVDNDIVFSFVEDLISERQAVSQAIGIAKAALNWDLDAAVAANKFRQAFSSALGLALSKTPSRKMTTGKDYKFNNDGDQTPYYYDLEIVTEDAYDRDRAKSLMKKYKKKADKVSAEIDEAMVNTQVFFDPKFDVNDTFDDIVEQYEAAL